MTTRGAPLSTATVVRVLLATAARRWLNRVSGQFGKAFRRKKADPGRTATPGKQRASRFAAPLLAVLFLFIGADVSSGIIRNLATTVGAAEGDQWILVDATMMRWLVRAEERMAAVTEASDERARSERERYRTRLARSLSEDVLGHEVSDEDYPLRSLSEAQRQQVERILDAFDAHGSAAFRSRTSFDWMGSYPWAAHSVRFRTLSALALCLTFLCIVLMSLGGANKDLGHVDWTVQWLFTFPVRARSLFLAKIVEYTVLNPASWIIHLPFLFMLLWTVGFGAWAIPLALGGSLYINLLLAITRVLLETWLRKRSSLERLKNVQALCTATGMLCMLAIYSLSFARLPFDLEPLAAAPAALQWLPWSVPASLIAGGGTAIAVGSIMVIGSICIVAIGVRIAEHLVRDGLLGGAGAYRGSRGGAQPGSVRRGFHGVVGRELVLLLRDRNLFVQSVIVPIVALGFQVVVSPALLTNATSDSRHGAALAFGVGAYLLMSGGLTALTGEGKALWLLYTFPRRIERVLFGKAVLWGVIAGLYTLVVIVVLTVLGGGIDLDGVVGAAMALAGIAIYAVIAVGIGILGTDPLAEEHRKVRPTVMYTYMALAGLFGYGFYAPPWTRLVLVVVCSLLAFAIWQIVRDRVPLLLDPVQRPAPRIALSDGLIAVLAFVVLQSVVAVIAVKAGVPESYAALLAFVIAGALVASFSLLSFWRRKVPDIFATIGIRALRPASSLVTSVLRGIALGAGAGSIALVYQRLVIGSHSVPFSMTFTVLAVIAAPLFEELIFRGLVFRGIRRSTDATVAILASAAIFAIVHPPASVVPVFGLGVAAAFSFERSGRLIAPMCTHAVYNAIVLAGVWL